MTCKPPRAIAALWLSVALLLPVLSSCYSYDEELPAESVGSGAVGTDGYINLTISVSNGTAYTRALPLGGENGDGREAGLERENSVSGITLILYKGALTSSESKVDFVAYYPTTLTSRDDPGTPYADKADEASYTTGNQRLDRGSIDFSATYHAIVIANRDMSATFPKGTPISSVRDHQFSYSQLFDGSATSPSTCGNFLMTSENDAVIDFSSITPTRIGDNADLYSISDAIRIERLAARIDFCTANATWDATRSGYAYTVGGSTGDLFVVTKVTPFNIYNETEYLLKRLQDTWTGTTITTTYLTDETTDSYVVDPKTSQKDNVLTIPQYLCPLASLSTLHSYEQTMGTIAPEATFTDAYGNLSIIVGYPMENTLMPTSHLKKYATGLAITGHYYSKSGSTYTDQGERIYYGYLRHQGESTTATYKAWKQDQLADDAIGSDGTPMNFGIVRNNIYRVSIEGINSESNMTIKIKVKKWDKFTHSMIYM